MSIERDKIASEARDETTAMRKMISMVGTVHIVRKRPAKRPGSRINRRPIVWGNPLKGHELEPMKKRTTARSETSADDVRASIAFLQGE